MLYTVETYQDKTLQSILGVSNELKARIIFDRVAQSKGKAISLKLVKAPNTVLQSIEAEQ